MIKVLVRKKPDRPTYQLYFVDPVTRREVTKTSGATTPKDAERAAADWQREINEFRGNDGDSWDWFRLRFKDEHLAGLSVPTQKSYYTALEAYETEMNPKTLKDLNSSAISQFNGKLLKRERPLSPSTIANYLTHLRSALNWADAVGMIKKPPKIRISEVESGRGRALTDAEYQQMLATCEARVGAKYAEQWRRFLQLLWLSGLRINEAYSLSWDSGPYRVDLEAQPYPCLLIGAKQKNRSEDAVPIPPDFYEWLRATPPLERRGKVVRLITEYGDEFLMKKVGLKVSEIGELAGIKTPSGHATAHDFRRSFGTRWAALVRPMTLKKIMRHKNIQTTLKYYLTLSAADAGQDLWQNVPKNVPNSGSFRVVGE